LETLRVEFTKSELMRFISHLDLLRLFQRALRRSGIPIDFSKGFNPHPLIYFDRAIKLGVESESEWAEFVLREEIDPAQFKVELQANLPKGIEIREVIK
jgi:radical SAM-linked protein